MKKAGKFVKEHLLLFIKALTVRLAWLLAEYFISQLLGQQVEQGPKPSLFLTVIYNKKIKKSISFTGWLFCYQKKKKRKKYAAIPKAAKEKYYEQINQKNHQPFQRRKRYR